jgi:hypothetical protein
VAVKLVNIGAYLLISIVDIVVHKTAKITKLITVFYTLNDQGSHSSSDCNSALILIVNTSSTFCKPIQVDISDIWLLLHIVAFCYNQNGTLC